MAGEDGAQRAGNGCREQSGGQQRHGNEDGTVTIKHGDQRRGGSTHGSEDQAQADRCGGVLGCRRAVAGYLAREEGG